MGFLQILFIKLLSHFLFVFVKDLGNWTRTCKVWPNWLFSLICNGSLLVPYALFSFCSESAVKTVKLIFSWFGKYPAILEHERWLCMFISLCCLSWRNEANIILCSQLLSNKLEQGFPPDMRQKVKNWEQTISEINTHCRSLMITVNQSCGFFHLILVYDMMTEQWRKLVMN